MGAAHPAGRRAVFLGDLVDRGPDSPGVLRLVMGMVAAGTALAVPGNHEDKLLRALRGRKVRVSHGLETTLEQLAAEPAEFRASAEAFLGSLTSHYVLDGGRLVVAHAGLAEKLQGRASGRVRSFCLYGQTTGETDSYGLPVRYPWAEDYRGRAMVLYGHTPVPAPEWVNNTLCLDTGCVFGGSLTALSYPERVLVSVPSARVYYEPARPFPAGTPQRRPGDRATARRRSAGAGTVPAGARREPSVLDITDVTGTRVIETGYGPRVKVGAANAAAALEVMSRFAVDPRWLLYLPPTMSPVSTAPDGELLEHPAQAFAAYADAGVRDVVCEEKHMGSRAVVLVCRSEADAVARFGVTPGMGAGAVWTRTGRPFFGPALTSALLDRVRSAAAAAGLFDELSHVLAAARRRAAAVVAPRRGSCCATSTPRSARPLARRCPPRCPCLSRRPAARLAGLDAGAARWRNCSRGPGPGSPTRTRSPPPTSGTAGRSRASTGCGSRRSRCSGPRARRTPARPHSWHLATASRLAAADAGLFTVTRHVFADTSDPASAPPRPAGGAS